MENPTQSAHQRGAFTFKPNDTIEPESIAIEIEGPSHRAKAKYPAVLDATAKSDREVLQEWLDEYKILLSAVKKGVSKGASKTSRRMKRGRDFSMFV
ncbi:hypothetical protein ACEPPN_015434 [Leptodophora sp. 'Broadleaf-Isolate-01']